MLASKRLSPWLYFLPALHLSACISGMSGLLVRSLEPLGIIWGVVMFGDFPVSIVAFALAWSHGTLAALWIFTIGTLWWYFLGRAAALILDTVKNLR